MKRNPSTRAGTAAKHGKMLEVLELFRIVFKSIRRHYQSVERRAGLSGAQLWALAQVAASPGIRVGELARALAVHQSTASNLLRALEGKTLILRRRLRKDQRSVQLFTTSEGLGVLGRAPQPLIGVLQHALSDLSWSDLEVLHRQLTKLVASMKSKDLAARATPLSDI